jgi:N-acetylmuramoyl-L-alanine amidase
MKVCIDPGHGMANRKPGVYDPGCVGNGREEAEIVMEWADELEKAFAVRGIPTFRTRTSRNEPTPVGQRASMAEKSDCTHFISIHVNDADSALAHGIETLYRDDSTMATKVQSALLAGLMLRDRGIKQRTDLAVLKFAGQAVLIELGFIKYPHDIEAMTNKVNIVRTCRLIVEAVA